MPPLTMALIAQHFLSRREASRFLAPHRPDQDQAGARRSDADRAQNIVRRRQRALHGPAHPCRACREHQAFKHKQDAHTDEEVGERYGPHRTETSRLMLFLRLAPGPVRCPHRPGVALTYVPYGFGAAGGVATAAAAASGAAGGLPDALLKNLKKSESGRNRKR